GRTCRTSRCRPHTMGTRFLSRPRRLRSRVPRTADEVGPSCGPPPAADDSQLKPVAAVPRRIATGANGGSGVLLHVDWGPDGHLLHRSTSPWTYSVAGWPQLSQAMYGSK